MSDKSKASFTERSIDTQLLVDHLKNHADDSAIEYEALSAVIGRDVRNGARSSLMSARRIVERDYSIVFDVIASVGLKRIPNGSIPASCGQFTKRIRNAAKRAVRRLHSTDLDKLTKQEMVEFNLQASFHGSVSQQTSQPSQKRLRAVVQEAGEKLPLTKTLEAFKS